MRFYICVFTLLVTCFLQAQNPSPARAQQSSVLILGGTAHLGNGNIISSSAIAFEQGKLTLVVDANKVKIDKAKYAKVFDASGKHIYPGLIALNTSLGLVEVDAIRSTRDTREIGEMNPSVRSLIAYNTDSDLIPTVRSNGVLLAQIVPQGGRISGTSSVVQLDAWNWEDAAVVADEGLHINWPQPQFSKAEEGGEAQESGYRKAVREMHTFFQESKAYAQVPTPETRLIKFEAMRQVFTGKTKVFVHASTAPAMLDAIHFARSFGLQLVLVGAKEAYLIADKLAAEKIPVILGSTQSLPEADEADYDQPYKTPSQLQKAGVSFAITDAGSWRQRNLPFQAGQAVAYGLDKEQALASITATPARILGLEQRLGTLEAGKDATLLISEGDLLDMRTSHVIAAWIDGREISLDDKHKQLYKKWRNKN